jgi:hypothetical protein
MRTTGAHGAGEMREASATMALKPAIPPNPAKSLKAGRRP